MNNLDILKDMIAEYNEEMILAAWASARPDKYSESKYRHGVYILAQFIERIATDLNLEIEQFDKKIEYLNDDYADVILNVHQIIISQR